MSSFPESLLAPRIVAASLVASLVGCIASPAVAHNVVEDRSPAPGAIVTQSPVTVSIGTNDAFLDLGGDGRGFALVALNDAGEYYGDGCVTVDQTVMSAVIALGNAGTYTIAYQFISADGHSLSDSYTIEFEPSPQHQPVPGQETAPLCGQNTPAAEDYSSESAVDLPVDAEMSVTEPRATEWSLTTVIGFGALVAVIIGLVGASVLSRRKGR
jgi:copper resistance protein C